MENKINNEIDDNVEVKTKEIPKKKKSKIFFIAGGVLFIISILALILGMIFASAIEPEEVQPEISTPSENVNFDDFQKKYEETQKNYEKAKEDIQSKQKQIEQKSKEVEKEVERVKESMDSPQETQKKASDIQKEVKKQQDIVEETQEEFHDTTDVLEDSSEESTQSLLNLE